MSTLSDLSKRVVLAAFCAHAQPNSRGYYELQTQAHNGPKTRYFITSDPVDSRAGSALHAVTQAEPVITDVNWQGSTKSLIWQSRLSVLLEIKDQRKFNQQVCPTLYRDIPGITSGYRVADTWIVAPNAGVDFEYFLANLGQPLQLEMHHFMDMLKAIGELNQRGLWHPDIQAGNICYKYDALTNASQVSLIAADSIMPLTAIKDFDRVTPKYLPYGIYRRISSGDKPATLSASEYAAMLFLLELTLYFDPPSSSVLCQHFNHIRQSIHTLPNHLPVWEAGGIAVALPALTASWKSRYIKPEYWLDFSCLMKTPGMYRAGGRSRPPIHDMLRLDRAVFPT